MGARQLHDRLGGLARQLAGLADQGRVQVQLALHPATLRSNSARTAPLVRISSSARSAWPGTYPFPTSIRTSAAIPSAPRAAALNDVAIEKKITVPPWAVQRIAPP